MGLAAEDRPGIDDMGDREFEYFIADLWRRQGYDAYPTKRSGDEGADVIADDGTDRLAIEVKWRSGGTIGPDYVRKIAGVTTRERFDRGALVTNVEFSDAAYREANEMDVKLYTGTQIRTLDKKHYRSPSKSRQRFWHSLPTGLGTVISGWAAIIGYAIDNPEDLATLAYYLLWLFAIYIIVDAFGGIMGFDLPGGV